MISSLPINEAILGLTQRLDLALGLILFLVRYTVCFSLLPGLGQGAPGLAVRASAIAVLAGTSLIGSTAPPVPVGWGPLILMICAEVVLGLILGLIPQLFVAAAHLAGSLASTAMGLGAASLFDPSLGEQSSALGKLYGDLAIIIFLLMDGHHSIIIAAAGLGNGIPPGVFSPTTDLVLQMTTAMGLIFKLGILIASPIVATLLITQFILGILSKTIPSINVFFLSFPITVGLGLMIAALSLPSFLIVVQRAIVDTSHLLSIVW